MKELLEAIQARISDKVPAIKYVDEDWGQLDYYSSTPPVQWPCCLIDADNITWANLGNKQQQGTGTVVLHVANKKLTNTSAKAPVTQRNKAYAIQDVIQELHEALHTYLPTKNGGTLIRKSTGRNKRDDGIQHYIITYQCKVNGPFDTGQGLGENLGIGIEITR
jgi:hypothetical protein